MRVGNLDGRLVLAISGTTAIDVETASERRFGHDPQAVFEQWEEFTAWTNGLDTTGLPVTGFDESQLGPPVPAPRQVFAIGLNYNEHAAESGFEPPSDPIVFTKYVSSLSGPTGQVELPTDTVDWETELVAVIGRRAYRAGVDQAWDHVAALTAGQDLSERTSQHRGPAPQFNLAKSFPGFSPIGPVLVTPDEFTDRDDIDLGCTVNGVQVQKSSTRHMIFPVAELVSRLSHIVPLLPGDLIFTGTPSGVGAGREPKWFLRPGDELITEIGGIGRLAQRFTGPTVS
jgi:2,4-diketo-3-deoxy-L-fuconate hydrolase